MAKTKEEKAAYMKVWRSANQEYCKAYREANKERDADRANTARRKELAAARYQKNKESVSAKAAEWRTKNSEYVLSYNLAYYRENKKRLLAKQNAYQAVCTEQLTDGYVSAVLKIPVAECPTELLALKREQLTIKRLSRQIKQTTKAHNETSTNIS